MEGYILTLEQKQNIQEVEFAPYQFFYCVQDINDIWFTFLSEQDKETIVNTQWDYLLNLTEGEYVPKPIILPNE